MASSDAKATASDDYMMYEFKIGEWVSCRPQCTPWGALLLP
jgi:hypothetical protein